jgi:hypothetical protein
MFNKHGVNDVGIKFSFKTQSTPGHKCEDHFFRLWVLSLTEILPLGITFHENNWLSQDQINILHFIRGEICCSTKRLLLNPVSLRYTYVIVVFLSYSE